MADRITGRMQNGTAFIRSETGNEGVGHFTTQRRLPEIIAKLAELEDKIESEELVEVVKCKDCKFWDAVNNPKHAGKGICKPPNRSLGGYCTRRGATLGSDYCSYGERKGDEK